MYFGRRLFPRRKEEVRCLGLAAAYLALGIRSNFFLACVCVCACACAFVRCVFSLVVCHLSLVRKNDAKYDLPTKAKLLVLAILRNVCVCVCGCACGPNVAKNVCVQPKTFAPALLGQCNTPIPPILSQVGDDFVRFL
jgi:hypothetical protein